jgi:hypothetical protein
MLGRTWRPRAGNRIAATRKGGWTPTLSQDVMRGMSNIAQNGDIDPGPGPILSAAIGMMVMAVMMMVMVVYDYDHLGLGCDGSQVAKDDQREQNLFHSACRMR